MEDLKSRVKNKYAWLNSRIFIHGQNYFLTASSLYPQNYLSSHAYPLLTLLGLSTELFFKAFDIEITRDLIELEEGGPYSVVNETVKSLNNGRNESNKHNGHNLKKLLEHYSTADPDLFDYLTAEYKSKTQRDLVIDLESYSKIFEHTRYIFEHEQGKYFDAIEIVFNLVKSLYESINCLYKK